MSKRARTDIYPETDTFHYYNANPKNRITGDCSVRAISTVLGKSWTEVVMEMAELGCKNGYSPWGRENIDRYLKLNGWTKCRQPKKWDNTKYTAEEFCEVQQHYAGEIMAEWDDGIVIAPKIVVSVGGHHISCIINGKINDIWDCTDNCVGNYWVKYE